MKSSCFGFGHWVILFDYLLLWFLHSSFKLIVLIHCFLEWVPFSHRIRLLAISCASRAPPRFLAEAFDGWHCVVAWGHPNLEMTAAGAPVLLFRVWHSRGAHLCHQSPVAWLSARSLSELSAHPSSSPTPAYCDSLQWSNPGICCSFLAPRRTHGLRSPATLVALPLHH